MVHYQKKIILLGLLLSIRGTSSKWCWTCQCIFARWSLLGPELGCCSSMSFDIDIMIHVCCVCVTRWMARCKQPESEDWLDADQWTCQSMPKWLVAAVSNRLWKSLDLSTLFDHILRKAVLTEARCKRHEHGTNKQTSDVSAIDTSTSQSCTAKNPQK